MAAEESRRSEAELDERWQRVLADAEVRAVEAHRAEVLAARTDRWRAWQTQHAYVDGLEERLDELAGEERAAALEWISWSRAHLAETDPLLVRHTMPAPPAMTREVLEPHIRGWAGVPRSFPTPPHP